MRYFSEDEGKARQPKWNRLYTGRTQPRRFPGVQTTKRETARIIRDTDADTSKCHAEVPMIGECGTPITGIQVSPRQRLVGCIRCRWVSLGTCWECGLLPHQRQSSNGVNPDVLCLGCRITRDSPTRPAGNKKKRGRPRQ